MVKRDWKHRNSAASPALVFALCLAIVVSFGPSIAIAAEPEVVPLAPPPAEAPQLEHFEYWRARGDEAIARVDAAELALAEANAAVSRMRRRNHPRGEQRIQIREERDRAREAYEAARHHLQVELPAEVRRAGWPRHWVARRS